MSGEVGQWDLEKFVLLFRFSPTLSRQWEMSNAFRRGEEDELYRGSENERERRRKRQQAGRASVWVPHQLTEGGEEGGRRSYLCSEGREWLMCLHLDIEATI